MSFPLARNERCYAVVESTYGIIPSVGNNDAFRHNLLELTNIRNRVTPGYKTGSLSNFEFVKTRRSGNWALTMDLLGAGTPGNAPDADPIFQGIFRQAPSSGVYTLADSPVTSFSLYKFRNPSGFNDQIAHGCVVTDAEFTLGQDIALARLSGRCLSVLEKDYFASADADEKGGLGAFPAEPGSPAYNGFSITGFTGTVTLDGTPITADFQSAAIRMQTGAALVDTAFGHYYPVEAESDVRAFTISFTMWDSNAAITQTLRNKALTQTPIAASITVGTIAGGIYTFAMPKVVLTAPRIDEQRRLILNFADCLCLASSASAKDEVTMTVA